MDKSRVKTKDKAKDKVCKDCLHYHSFNNFTEGVKKIGLCINDDLPVQPDHSCDNYYFFPWGNENE